MLSVRTVLKHTDSLTWIYTVNILLCGIQVLVTAAQLYWSQPSLCSLDAAKRLRPARRDQVCCLINLLTLSTGNPVENSNSQIRTHLYLCCVFSYSLQCGASCDLSVVLAIYKLRTCCGTRRFGVTIRMLTTGRHRNLFNIMALGLVLHIYLSYIHTLFYDTLL
jgi:hypothetical protein